MVNSQEWLDREYPKEIREDAEEVYINEPNLEGVLDFSDFAKLETVYLSHCIDKVKVRDKNKKEIFWVKLEKAQEWLDKNYPKETREEIRKLDISGWDYERALEGELDLRDFINLEKLNCSKNKLTALNLSKNSKLVSLCCGNNLLTSIDLSGQTPENLKKIWLSNNNLDAQDLNCFSTFTNLVKLHLSNDDDNEINIKRGKFNRWFGSLSHLKNLTKLVELSISGTDIDNGLEYMNSEELKIFFCAGIREGAKVEAIKQQLNLSERQARGDWSRSEESIITNSFAPLLIVETNKREKLSEEIIKEAQNNNEITSSVNELVSIKLSVPDISTTGILSHNFFQSSITLKDDNYEKIKNLEKKLLSFENIEKKKIEELCSLQETILDLKMSIMTDKAIHNEFQEFNSEEERDFINQVGQMGTREQIAVVNFENR